MAIGEQLLLGTSALQILSESSSPACSCLLLSSLPPPFLLQSLAKLPSSASAHLDGVHVKQGDTVYDLNLSIKTSNLKITTTTTHKHTKKNKHKSSMP